MLQYISNSSWREWMANGYITRRNNQLMSTLSSTLCRRFQLLNPLFSLDLSSFSFKAQRSHTSDRFKLQISRVNLWVLERNKTPKPAQIFINSHMAKTRPMAEYIAEILRQIFRVLKLSQRMNQIKPLF